ncbi:MAG TPA: hypothetical protein VH234_04860 [Candidatus Saccharimonadales bacterium]|jgi:hypothetical protein|nr:hypothetical protein [Candidatus Saccharimonadales bacterium]
MLQVAENIDYKRLRQLLEATRSDQELFQQIVDAPFEQKLQTAFMFLGIIVLLVVNKRTGTIDRIALSNTDLAQNARRVSVVPFEEIKIPLQTRGNIVALAIKSREAQDTTDWRFLFNPVLNAKQARINQASAGIAYSAVYPLKAHDGGAMIFSYYQYEHGIGSDQRNFMTKYTKLVGQSLK